MVEDEEVELEEEENTEEITDNEESGGSDPITADEAGRNKVSDGSIIINILLTLP